MPRLLTVLLNWRTPGMTLEAAEAALREMAGLQGELVIVDNDSGDGSFETLRAEAEARGWVGNGRVRVIQSGRNGGFGAGNNAGIRAGLSDGSVPDLVYVLNSDAFPGKGAIKRLVEALDGDPGAGLAGSYIHGPDGTPHVTAFRFPSILSEFEGAARLGPLSRFLRRHRVPMEVPEATQAVPWLAGASLLVRREVLDRIGLFDETFFLYFEETDLCRRAADAGWRTLYVRESEVTHIGSVSTGMKTWTRIPSFWLESRWHYFAKTHGRTYAAAATLAHLAGGLLWQLRRLVQSKPQADPPHFLRDLVAHDARALFMSRPRSAAPDLGVRLPSGEIR